jgi:hypothetical protein
MWSREYYRKVLPQWWSEITLLPEFPVAGMWRLSELVEVKTLSPVNWSMISIEYQPRLSPCPKSSAIHAAPDHSSSGLIVRSIFDFRTSLYAKLFMACLVSVKRPPLPLYQSLFMRIAAKLDGFMTVHAKLPCEAVKLLETFDNVLFLHGTSRNSLLPSRLNAKYFVCAQWL